ncbi:hypothetical protein [Brevundimonas sp. A19_0]|uniref:hypothetical protein n=1 Tax=Brevundimonas sp. A19_0 TaxID=2821087 RepID=UPI001ADAB145|nr:hypothetical protein [Brevundimonas sp. A19_0]MBO9501646.1 hypothetical protein [Brevundimonas sp. A19_0]
MEELPQSLFDVYALALPRGHGFGDRPPVGAWRDADGTACGIARCDDITGVFGVLVMRRRVDHVWTVVADEHGFASLEETKARIKLLLREGEPLEPLPANTAARPALHDLKGRVPSQAFDLLRARTHQRAGWILNQLYLALPNPDKTWAGDCQTVNFHTRLWEAQLLASFREQGLLVTQPHESPDFHIENRKGDEAWVEAVTANPAVLYEHVNAPRGQPPQAREELFFGPAAVRFAKTLGNKLERNYHALPHVAGKPFMIALADFQAPASMTWSREGLIGYLYGQGAEVVEVDGRPVPKPVLASHLLGPSAFPAGLFTDDRHAELSAVIFSNACSMAKLNRVMASAAGPPDGLRYVRIGRFFDRTPGALEGIPFCLDVASEAYRSLWPQSYEPWSAEMEVFHNPFARHPVPFELLPEATHWFDQDGEMMCRAHYPHAILWSQTLIQDADAPMPRLGDFLPAQSRDDEIEPGPDEP